MATLACTVVSEGVHQPPVKFELVFAVDEDRKSWLVCTTRVTMIGDVNGNLAHTTSRKTSVPSREIERLAKELEAFTKSDESTQPALTFMPIVPSFELWLQRLSDEQIRVIVWMDMARELGGNSDVVYQGLRYTTNLDEVLSFSKAISTEIAE